MASSRPFACETIALAYLFATYALTYCPIPLISFQNSPALGGRRAVVRLNAHVCVDARTCASTRVRDAAACVCVRSAFHEIKDDIDSVTSRERAVGNDSCLS
ncbi:unnamed protein product, partial [Iphiclides podalirius]